MALKSKITAAILVWGAVLAGVSAGCVWPIISRLRETGAAIAAQNEKIAGLDRQVRQIENFRNFYRKEEINFLKVDEAFVNSDMPLQFIDYLNALARDCQTAIKMEPGASLKIKNDAWPSISFQVSLTGTFSGIGQFIKKIEVGAYLVEIQNVRIAVQAGGAAGDDGVGQPDTAKNVSASILLKAYAKQ